MGRPSAYTEAIAEEICQRIAEGETLRAICRDEAMPARSNVQQWIGDDREGFQGRYARARESQFENMADEIAEIADDGTDPHDRRVRIDTRKWLLSKLKPERYGDSLKLTGELEINHKTDDQLTARLAQLLSETGSDSDPGGAGAA